MEAISLSAIAANAGGVIVAGLAMIGYLKKSIRAEAQSVVDKSAVSKDLYDENHRIILDRLAKVERFDHEFTILKNNQEHMQSDVTEIKADMKLLTREVLKGKP